MKKLNVWFFSPNGQPKGHGSRIYNYSLELIKRGHRVTVFVKSFIHRSGEEYLFPNEKFRIEEIEGIRIVWLRSMHYYGNNWRRGVSELQFAWRAYNVAKKFTDKSDVIIGDSVPPINAFAGLKVAKRKKAAFVYQVRDVWPIALVYDGSLSKKSLTYLGFRLIEKHLYRKSQRICATMPFLHKHVLESGGDPNRITCVPNGVSLNSYHKYEEYDGGKNYPLVAMYVGSLSFAHDVITIIKTAKLFKEKGMDKYKFFIIGDGVNRAECERAAELNKLANVEFRDTIPKIDVPEIQNGADIFIACVLDSKAYQFGINLNKIYDYFASGRPVIFAGNAPNDHVRESGAGFSIPPENPEAMAYVLEKYLEMSPEGRKQMGIMARNYAEKVFDTRKLAGRFEKLLYEAINDK